MWSVWSWQWHHFFFFHTSRARVACALCLWAPPRPWRALDPASENPGNVMYFDAHCQSSVLYLLCISPVPVTGLLLSVPAKHAISLLPWSLTCCVGLSNLPDSCKSLTPEARIVPGRPVVAWVLPATLGTRNLPVGTVIADSKDLCSWTLSEAYLSVLSPSFPCTELNFPAGVACPFELWTAPFNISSN